MQASHWVQNQQQNHGKLKHVAMGLQTTKNCSHEAATEDVTQHNRMGANTNNAIFSFNVPCKQHLAVCFLSAVFCKHTGPMVILILI